MSKQEHTPGPWTLHLRKDGGNWDYQVRTVKPHNPAGGLGCHVATVNKYLDDPSANARLIAAAPDLLEACEDLLKQEHEQKHEYDLWYDTAKIRAAIAKARP